MTIVSISLQTDELIPESGDLSNLKILCVSIFSTEAQMWLPPNNKFKRANHLSQQQVSEIVDELSKAKVVSWNGLGFDLQVLYHNCCDSEKKKIKKIAKKHTDLGFAFMCENGYMTSLTRLGFNTEITSSSIPILWKASRVGQDLVVKTNLEKSKFLIQMYQKIINNKKLEYNSKSGSILTWIPITFKDKPLSVKNASLIESDNDLPDEIKQIFNKDRFLSWVD